MLKTKLISFEIEPSKASTDSVKELSVLAKAHKAGQPVSVDEWLSVGLPVGKRLLKRMVGNKELEGVVKRSLKPNWKVRGIELVGKIEGQVALGRGLEVSSDGNYLVFRGQNLVARGGHNLMVEIADLKAYLKAETEEAKNAAIKIIDAKSGGHDAEWIISMAISSDSKYLFSGSEDETIKITDLKAYLKAETEEEKKAAIKTIDAESGGHSDRVRSVAVSSDGEYLFSGSDDGTVKITDVEAYLKAETKEGKRNAIKTIDANYGWAYSVTVGLAGEPLSSWSADKADKITRLESRLTSETSWVTIVRGSPNGKYLISGGNSGEVKITDVKAYLKAETEEERKAAIKTIEAKSGGHRYSLTTILISPDSKYLFSGSEDQTIKITDLEAYLKAETEEEKKAAIKTIDAASGGHISSIDSAAISSDGEYLISRDGNGTVKLTSVEAYLKAETEEGKRNAIKTIDAAYGCRACSFVFSPDGKYLFLGNEDATVKMISLEAYQKAETEEEQKTAVTTVGAPVGDQTGAILSMAFDPTGEYLYLGSDGLSKKILRIIRKEQDG